MLVRVQPRASSRGGEAWYLGRLITSRPLVQIQPPQLLREYLVAPSPSLIRTRKWVRLPHSRHAGVAQRKSRVLTKLRSGVQFPPPVQVNFLCIRCAERSDGGIGRRTSLRCWRWKHRVSSSLSPSTLVLWRNLVDAPGSEPGAFKSVRVRIPLGPPTTRPSGGTR